ncbi:response regulator [bacterium]|nr:response regulator [bacterium]
MIRLSYQRLFRTFSAFYLPALIYYCLWLPERLRMAYVLTRLPLLLLSLVGSTVIFSQLTYRILVVSVMVCLMVGNALGVHDGAPFLVPILAQAGFVLHGFLETDQAWTLVLNSFVALVAVLAQRLAGVDGGAQIPPMILFGTAHALVWFRWRALSRLALVLSEQVELNRRNHEAVEVLQDFNALLGQRVEERRRELQAAENRLRQAYQDLQQMHQQQADLQSQWLQAQRLAALAHFAHGLSHCFSNTLTCIWGCLPDLRSRDPEAVNDITQACETAHRICQRMMLAGKAGEPSAQRFDLNRLLVNSQPLLQRAVPNPIRLECSQEECFVAGDPTALDQVLWNLVLNAAQASSPTAPITIRVKPEAHRYILEVSDCGCGIDSTTQERIFEPFFTTRQGQGHGLGLAIVRQAAEGLGASVRVTSQPGLGTTFAIGLPQAERVPVAAVEASRGPVVASHARHIALVEDQDALRRLIGGFLRKQNCEVEIFATAEELGEPRTGFDVLVTDVNLPGRDGVQLAQEWAQANLDLKILFISGYPFEASAVPIDPSRWLFLAKPFKLTELINCVSRLSPEQSEEGEKKRAPDPS